MNKEISENLKEALENLQWCQTNVLYYEINNDKARELYKYIQELQHQLEEKDKVINEVKKYCKFKSKFNCFGDSLTEKAINTYVNATKKDILDILERGKKC